MSTNTFILMNNKTFILIRMLCSFNAENLVRSKWRGKRLGLLKRYNLVRVNLVFLVQPSNFMDLTSLVPRSLIPKCVSRVFPPNGWFEVYFDGSVRGNKVGAGFIVHNDIGVMIGASSISITIALVLDTEIRGLGEILI